MSANFRVHVRARPDINQEALLHSLQFEAPPTKPEEEARSSSEADLGFNRASSAMKWLLAHLRVSKGRELRVGIQALTCPTVISAILESQNIPVFLDISPEHLSTPLSEIRRVSLDVLILTHLAGIANPEYGNISQECRRRGILLLEDLAQTLGATAGATKVGTLGDASILSFGVDKPISSFQGGMVKINKSGSLAAGLHHLESQYRKLPQESLKHARNDLQRLALYHDLTEPEVFRFGLNFGSLADVIAGAMGGGADRIRTTFRIVQSLPAYGIIDRIYASSARRLPLKIERINPLKVNYLATLFAGFPMVADRRRKIALLAKQRLRQDRLDLIFPDDPAPDNASPCRLAALAQSASVRKEIVAHLAAQGIEAGGFNWSYLALDRFPRLRRQAQGFPIARDVSSRILNLPIWSESIWQERHAS